MSYRNLIISDLALAYYPLDNPAPTNMVNGASAIVSGTLTQSFPVVSGEISSPLITESTSIEISAEGTLNNANKPFTWEAWVRELESGELIMIFDGGNTSLSIEANNVINYTLAFVAGNVVVSRPLPLDLSVFHVVVTYDTNSINLFINGELVETEFIDVDYVRSGFVSSSTLTIGGLAGGQESNIGSIAIYGESLKQFNIQKHYRTGIAYNDPTSFASSAPFLAYVFNDDGSKRIQSDIIDILDGTQLGPNPVLLDGTRLYTRELDAATEEGAYVHRFPLIPATIQGAKLEWSGMSNAEVTVSFDGGETYGTPLISPASILPDGSIIPDDTYLLVKVYFPGDNAIYYVEDLTLTVYQSKFIEINEDDDGSVTNPDAVTIYPNNFTPLALERNSGTLFGTNSGMVIPYVSGLPPVKTIEMMFKVDGEPLGDLYLLSNSEFSVRYDATTREVITAGVDNYHADFTLSGEFIEGKLWHHLIITLTYTTTLGINVPTNVTFDGTAQVQVLFVKVYSEVIQPSEVAEIRAYYFGIAPYRVTPTNYLEISSPPVTYLAAKWN